MTNAYDDLINFYLENLYQINTKSPPLRITGIIVINEAPYFTTEELGPKCRKGQPIRISKQNLRALKKVSLEEKSQNI